MATCFNCGFEVSAESFNFCPSCGTQAFAATGPGNDLVGRTLNEKYRVLEEVGSGSMGTVYRAEHIRLKKAVALKVLHPELRVGDEALQRLQREGIAAGKFNHPNAIQIFDFDRAEPNIVYLAMEFVEGTTLADWVRAEGGLPVATAVDLGLQLLRVLAEAHSRGIVHRDLKPANLLVTQGSAGERTLKVLDFGLSKLVDLPVHASLQTQTGRIVGTPLYMAPEQCAGLPVDHRADLYAVGLILFEAVAGKPVFHGDSIAEILYKHTAVAAPSLAQACPGKDVPADLDAVVARALQKNPDQRFASAAEMLQALAQVRHDVVAPRGAAGTRIVPPPPAWQGAGTALQPRRSSLGVIAVLLFLLVAAAGAFALLTGNRLEPVPEAGASLSSPRLPSASPPPAEAAGRAAAPAASATPLRVAAKPEAERSATEQRYVQHLEEARRLLRAGDTDAAQDEIKAAHALPCRDAEAFLLRAELFRRKGTPEIAQLDLAEALRLDPGHAGTYLARARLSGEGERWEEAEADLRKALELDPGSAEILAELASCLYARSAREEAERRAGEALEQDDSQSLAYVVRGHLRLDRGDQEGAREDFQQAERYDPDSWRAQEGLGRVAEAAGQTSVAESRYRQALNANPGSLTLRIRVAALLAEAGRFRDAEVQLRTGLREFPNSALLHGMLASVYVDLELPDDAVKEATRSIELDPFALRPRLLLGLLHQRAGRLEDALRQYQEALELDPASAQALLSAGIALFQRERFDEAADALESALSHDPDLLYAHLMLGVLYMDYLPDPESAARHLESYEDRGGKDARVAGWLSTLRHE